MERSIGAGRPAHLWVVGILATVWNAFGAYDYLMTRMRDEDYLAAMMPGVPPEQALAWIDAFPIWAQAGWGLGVWGGLLGSILLLVRSRFAVHAFMASIVGVALSFSYQFIGAPPLPGMADGTGAVMPIVITIIAALLLWYAVAMRRKGILR